VRIVTLKEFLMTRLSGDSGFREPKLDPMVSEMRREIQPQLDALLSTYGGRNSGFLQIFVHLLVSSESHWN
jgi:hypothetical protein